MDLLLLGGGTGIVGGIFPSPLHLIALAQVGLARWRRAIFILVGPPLLVDGLLLLVTFFFYQYIPQTIAHDVAYLGGAIVAVFGTYSTIEGLRKGQENLARSAQLTYASVTVAMLGEVAAPGTWVYWLTIAGPIISEGRLKGYLRIVPFFAGGLVGYYGAAIFSVWLIGVGASFHKEFKKRLFLVANVLLIILGISYLVRAYLAS